MKFSKTKRILVLVLAVALLIGSVFLFRLFSAPPSYEEVDARLRELIELSHEVNAVVFGEGLPTYERIYDPRSSTEVIRTGEFVTNSSGEEVERLIYYYYTLEDEHRVLAYRDSYLKDFSYALLSDKKMTAEELKTLFPPSEGDTAEYYAEIHADEAAKQFCYIIPYVEEKHDFYYSDADDKNYDYVRTDAKYRSVEQVKELVASVYSKEYASSLYGTLFDGVASGGVIMKARYAELKAANGALLLAQSNEYEPLKVEKRVYLYDTAKIRWFSSNKNTVRILIDSYLPSNPSKVTTREITIVKQNGDWFLASPTF